MLCNSSQLNIASWKRPLMTSDIRVGRGSKIAPKIGRYRVGQGRYLGRSKMAKKRGTSLMDVPLCNFMPQVLNNFVSFLSGC